MPVDDVARIVDDIRAADHIAKVLFYLFPHAPLFSQRCLALLKHGHGLVQKYFDFVVGFAMWQFGYQTGVNAFQYLHILRIGVVIDAPAT
jgi:hypothetical protein